MLCKLYRIILSGNNVEEIGRRFVGNKKQSRRGHALHVVKHNIETSHADVDTGTFKIIDMNSSTAKPLNSGHLRVLKICPLLRGACSWEVVKQRLSHFGLNILSAIHGMSAIWRFHCNNKKKLKIAESLWIKGLRATQNVQEKSIPLKLFN